MAEAALVLPEPELLYIPPQHIEAVWPQIEPFLPSVIERSRGRMTGRSLIESLVEGRRHLYCVFEGDAVLAVVGLDVGLAPSGLKVATIRFTAGEHSPRWIHLLADLEQHCRDNGCQKLEMWARKGWERKLPDYKMTHVMLEKDL